MLDCNTHTRRQRRAPIIWHEPGAAPASEVGHLYIVHLLEPYVKGARLARIGGKVEGGRLVGGEIAERPQAVYNYIGWAQDYEARYREHMNGQGSRLLAYLASIGWPMRLAWVAPGDLTLEARLKHMHNNRLICPDCLAEVRQARALERMAKGGR